MSYTMNELLCLLEADELPSYAQEADGGFLRKIFKNENQALHEVLAPALPAIRQYAGDHAVGDLHRLLASGKPVFSQTPQQLAEIHSVYPSLSRSSWYRFDPVVKAFLPRAPFKGLTYKVFRQLFYMASASPSGLQLLIEVTKHLPAEYHAELILLWAKAPLDTGGAYVLGAWPDIKYSAPHLSAIFEAHLPGCLAYSVSMSYEHLPSLKAAEVFVRMEMQASTLALPPHKWDITDLAANHSVAALDEEAKLAFAKLLILNYQVGSIGRKAEGDYLDRLLSGMPWQRRLLLDFLAFAKKRPEHYRLPMPVLVAARGLLAEDEDLGSCLRDYLCHLGAKGQAYPALETILRDDAVAKHPEPIHGVAPLLRLHFAGFAPVPPAYTQNVYKGMSPEQMRPFFQLMRAVADVDVLKFYQDKDKNHWVKFRIQAEQYDLQASNGLGVGIMGPLNTLLYEHGVPYQFTYLNRATPQLENATHEGHYSMFHRALMRVILVNEATYAAHQTAFYTGAMAGFAKPEGPPAVPFLKSLEEVGSLIVRQDMEQIDIATDPKFTVLREEVAKLGKLPPWNALLGQCLRYPMEGKPSKGWQAQATKMVAQVEPALFQSGHLLILDRLTTEDEWFRDTEKASALKGLAWMSRLAPGSGQLFMLQQLANRAYKKIPGGPLNAIVGNVALETLAQIGSLEAYGAFTNMEAKAAYNVYKRALAARKKQFADLLSQYAPEELADRSVPDHGLRQGTRRIPVEGWHLVLSLDGFKLKEAWEAPDGRVQKAVPTTLKSKAAAALKAAKAEGKAVIETLQAQARRIERTWLLQRTWAKADWHALLADHHLMGHLAARLVWQVVGSDDSFMYADGIHHDALGAPVTLPDESRIQLWHPVTAPVDVTLAWRDHLFAQRIAQPFKQAFREVYVLTPAEEAAGDQSLRFGGHHLRGKTLYSLGKTREWEMGYQSSPTFKVPGEEYLAVLNINGDILYGQCFTEALVFHAGTAHPAYQKGKANRLPLKEVPPVVCSEVMRDIDLFVAVASLGVDPYFDQTQTGDLMNYWRSVSFGDKSQGAMAEVRRDLLRRLLPMTKIGAQCSFEGNFLVVKGQLRTYKINLGSANILMLPNDQYLCIVPDPKKDKPVWLPFEGGDQTLMLILSKAFLLAEDSKILAQDIMRQIRF